MGRFEQCMAEGRGHMAREEWLLAWGAFERACKANGNSPEAHLLMATAGKAHMPEVHAKNLAQQGMSPAALGLSWSQALDPTSDATIRERAAALYGKRQVSACELAIATTKADLVVLCGEPLAKALKLRPDYADALRLKRQVDPFIGQFVASAASGGCFIATACYGSYEHPDVVVFRRLRDGLLQRSLPGRLAVRTYYLLSPRLASWIGAKPWLKSLVRRSLLEPLARHLGRTNNHEGVG